MQLYTQHYAIFLDVTTITLGIWTESAAQVSCIPEVILDIPNPNQYTEKLSNLLSHYPKQKVSLVINEQLLNVSPHNIPKRSHHLLKKTTRQKNSLHCNWLVSTSPLEDSYLAFTLAKKWILPILQCLQKHAIILKEIIPSIVFWHTIHKLSHPPTALFYYPVHGPNPYLIIIANNHRVSINPLQSIDTYPQYTLPTTLPTLPNFPTHFIIPKRLSQSYTHSTLSTSYTYIAIIILWVTTLYHAFTYHKNTQYQSAIQSLSSNIQSLQNTTLTLQSLSKDIQLATHHLNLIQHAHQEKARLTQLFHTIQSAFQSTPNTWIHTLIMDNPQTITINGHLFSKQTLTSHTYPSLQAIINILKNNPTTNDCHITHITPYSDHILSFNLHLPLHHEHSSQ